MTAKPQQPEGHDNKCPCHYCDEWANALLDWEEAERKKGNKT